ncbi:hypothetical protein WDW37_04840 [Bdellovibrionota bacterium FG-1]
MKNTTQDMSATTAKMSDTTTKMSDQMSQTNSKMDEMTRMTGEVKATANETLEGVKETLKVSKDLYADNRQGASLTIRRNALIDMENAQTMKAKMAFAAAYFMAFEYQLYKADGFDTDDELARLKKDAVNEFFRVLDGYNQGEYDISPASTNNNMMNLMALATAIHMVNTNLEIQGEKKNLPKMSMLQMLEDTLAKRKQFDAGELVPADWEHQILVNATKGYLDSVYLLQLRANFLGAMVLDKLTNISHANFFRKGLSLLFHYNVDLTIPNIQEFSEFTIWLNESIRTRDFLLNQEFDPRMDSKVVKLFRHMDLVTTVLTETPTQAQKLHMVAENKLIRVIENFRK